MTERVKHTVTVVIPCYNDGEYIMSSLDSVLRQTVPPEKIIIVDDGSSRDTLDILKSIKNDLVEIIFQKNQGVCVARNNGIHRAKTSYILTLDADDRFDSTFIEKAIRTLESDDNLGAVCSFYKYFGKNVYNSEIIKPLGGSVENFLVMNNGLGCCLFKKQCWVDAGGYDETFKDGYEDWDFWLTVLGKGWVMDVIKEPLFYYRQKSISRDFIANDKFDHKLRMQLFEKHKELYKKYFETFAHQVIWRNSVLSKNIIETKQKMEFQIGKFLIAPLHLIKKIVSPNK